MVLEMYLLSRKDMPTEKRYTKRVLVVGDPSDGGKRFWSSYFFWIFSSENSSQIYFFYLRKTQTVNYVFNVHFNGKNQCTTLVNGCLKELLKFGDKNYTTI